MKYEAPLRRFAHLAALASLLALPADKAEAGNPLVATGQTSAAPANAATLHLSYAPIVKRVAPAVANIYTKRVVRQQAFASPLFNDPIFRNFFGEMFGGQLPQGATRARVMSSLGSGVIVAPDGLIVTAHHVIEGADEIMVALPDRREFSAHIVADDSRSDLALLRIDTKGEVLPFLTLADSDGLEVGDVVLAIGNPFGVGQTVTSGIVSGLARTNIGAAEGISGGGFFIQTDAAINPGNSGGALVTSEGQLAGINSAIVSKDGGSLGIGFAVPANMVKRLMDAEKEGGVIIRPWLGLKAQALTADLARAMDMKRPGGVLVRSLHDGSPLKTSGIKAGDVITAIDGRAVDEPEALDFRIGIKKVGDSVTLDYLRAGAEEKANVKLVAAPALPPPETLRLIDGRHPLLGATIENLSPALAEKLHRPADEGDEGVVITGFASGSVAERLGLRTGDRIASINGADIHKTADVKAALAQRTPQGIWEIVIERDGELQRLVLR